ncbi:ABC-2 family transporter protein [Candidatus Daviesbacteria bacterium]|nr:ABC-2 family transporter protein [Candidatus Daviesbacteria bacterium]
MSFRKYWVCFKSEWQQFLEYRVDLLIYTLSGAVIPLVALAVWLAVSSSGANLSFSQAELVIYFLMAMWVNIFVSAWGAYFIGEDIKTGVFSRYLVKPFSLFDNNFINNISEKSFKLIIASMLMLFIGYLLSRAIPLEVNISFLSFSFFTISLFFAATIYFFMDMIIGLATFWVHDNEFLRYFSNTLRDFLSGRVIPVLFLPGWLYTISFLSPFRYVLSFPIEVLLNKLGLTDLLIGFAIQVLWAISMIFFYKLLYQKGIRLYQGFGS